MKQKTIQQNTVGMKINSVFATSIWDETLYKVFHFSILTYLIGLVGHRPVFDPEFISFEPVIKVVL